jgi:cytochrome c oxidase subunit 3
MSSPGAVVALRPHAREDANSYLGIVIALASWAMLFAGIFFVYAATRANATEWPPAGMPRLPRLLPGLNSVVIVASSFTLRRGLAALRRNEVESFEKMVGLTIVLGLVFLELQGLLWSRVAESGVHFGSGLYGAVFYCFTIVHATHIVAGLGALGWVMVRAFKGVYSAHNWFGVRSVAFFWHFVDVVWLVMFVTVFVL